MVSLATKAFSQADAALAQRVFAMDDGVDELYDRCEQVVVDLIRSETQGASHLPELLMVAKYFERMGDDAERIASWAVFRATGEHALTSAGKENAEDQRPAAAGRRVRVSSGASAVEGVRES